MTDDFAARWFETVETLIGDELVGVDLTLAQTMFDEGATAQHAATAIKIEQDWCVYESACDDCAEYGE